jgi:hypothetical protein
MLMPDQAADQWRRAGFRCTAAAKIRAADLGLGPVQVINMSLVMRHPSR